jgi:hypothetical protein
MEIDFIVNAFGFGVSLTLAHPLRRRRYLSFSSVVEYTQKPGQWIFEKDTTNESLCYIKVSTPLPNFQQYLGSPNSDNSLGLYTTKGRFTCWSIQKIEGDLITVRYAGQKFNRDDVQLVIANRGDNLRWVSAYKDIAVIYNGKKYVSFLTHITKQYTGLKKRLFFLDGSALQKNNTILYAIDNYEQLRDVVPLGFKASLNKSTTVTEYGLAYTVIKIMRDAGYSTDTGLTDPVARKLQAEYKVKYKTTGGLNILEYFLKMANLPIDGPTYNYTFGSLVTVTRESIVQRSSDVYTGLLNIVTADLTDFIDSVIGRLWYHIMLNTPSESSSIPSSPAIFINRSITPERRATPPTSRATTPIYRPPIIPQGDISANRSTTPIYRPQLRPYLDISANRPAKVNYDISANRARTPIYRPPITPTMKPGRR